MGGFGCFLPKGKFSRKEMTYSFISEAHFCPLMLLRGDSDQRCTTAGKIKLEMESHVSFHAYVGWGGGGMVFSFSFTNFIHHTPSRKVKTPSQSNPNTDSLVFVSMGILREGEGEKEN